MKETTVYIRFFYEAKSSNAKKNVYNKIQKKVNDIFDNFRICENGDVIECEAVVKFDQWSALVYYLFEISEELGRSFVRTGAIRDGVDIWSNEPLIVGVKAVGIVCENMA